VTYAELSNFRLTRSKKSIANSVIIQNFLVEGTMDSTSESDIMKMIFENLSHINKFRTEGFPRGFSELSRFV